MATSNIFHKAAWIGVAALFLSFVTSCGGDDDDVITPTPEPIKGEVSFTIEIPNNGGGTSTSPAAVTSGETLNITISQKSSYTDTDGSVFTCEPKATIALHSHVDTVFTKDKNDLLTGKGTPVVKSTQSGSSPVTYTIVQQFPLGNDKYIEFDLAYEIYKYTNKAKQTVDMPYIKTNEAQYGRGTADNSTRSVIKRDVTLKPLAQTRSTVISDTTLYEVNETYSVELQSMNTKQPQSETVTFTVQYVGAVIGETVLNDPVWELTHEFVANSGTSSTASPFNVNLTEQLDLTMHQTSRYVDELGSEIVCHPDVKIHLKAKNDSAFVSDVEALASGFWVGDIKFEALPDDGQTFVAQPVIDQGKHQAIETTISYNYLKAEFAEGDVRVMPYYKVSDIQTGTPVLTELGTTMLNGREATCYDVALQLTLGFVSEEIEPEQTQSVETVIHYIGIVQEEAPELVDMEYRKGWYWIEDFCDWPFAYVQYVERDRIFSDGSVVTDWFSSNGHTVDIMSGSHVSMGDSFHEYGCDVSLIDKMENDSMYIERVLIETDDISAVEKADTLVPGSVEHPDFDFGKWEYYVPSRLFNEVDGWYYFTKELRYFHNIFCKQKDGTTKRVFHAMVDFFVSDQYLLIDGVRIDFLEYKPEFIYSLTEESVSTGDPYGPGKKFITQGTVKVFGRSFVARFEIYVRKRQ